MVYLAYTGMDAMFLTEDPDFTPFKSVYVRDEQYTTKVIEQTFDQTNYNVGDTLISTLKQNGDFLMDISLKVILPKITTGDGSFWTWYTKPLLGSFVYGFDSTGVQVFTVQLNSRSPYTNTTNWYTLSATGVSLSFNLTTQKTTFNTGSTSISYLVFSNFETARLFGFVNNPIQLFSGFLRFNVNKVSPTSQLTFQECGWLSGNSSISSYSDDICYDLINSVSLYVGKQLIQEFDSNYIKFRKDTDTPYKNRPLYKLLEGDTNAVDFNRIYYFDLPFIQLPVYAIPRHDIQIRVATNPLVGLSNFYASLVISFGIFRDTKVLPKSYRIPFKQIQYFSKGADMDIRGPLNTVFTNGDPNFEFKLNGERYFGSERTATDSMRSEFVNIPRTSNVVVFDGPVNMSRIRDQNWQSSNTNVYAETWNILAIENDMAGLLFDYTSVRGGYPKSSTNATVPQPTPTPDELYIFDYIPATAANVVAMYSLRRVSIYYTGPVVRLRIGTTEDDFYTDSTQSYLKNSSNVSVTTWAGESTVYVTRWYEQNGSGNYLYGGQLSPFLVIQDGKYVIFFDNPNAIFTQAFYTLTFSIPVSFKQFVTIIKPVKFAQENEGNESFVIYGSGSVRYSNNSTGSVTNGNFEFSPGVVSSNVNGVQTTTCTVQTWNTLTAYWGSSSITNVYLVSDTPGHGAKEAMNGHIFELGFFNGNTLSGSEANAYYLQRPAGF